MNADDLHCFCVVVAFTPPGFLTPELKFDSCCAVPFLSGAFYTFADVRGIEPPWETEQILLLHTIDILQQIISIFFQYFSFRSTSSLNTILHMTETRLFVLWYRQVF